MRWAKMQKVNVPIAPKPGISIQSDTILVGPKMIQTGLDVNSSILINSVPSIGALKSENIGTGGKLFTSQDLSKERFVEGNAVVTMEGQGCNKMTQMFGRTVHKGPAAQQETLSLLQQHLRSQSQAESVDKGQGQRNVTVSESAVRSNQPRNQAATDFNQITATAVNVTESTSPLKSDSLAEPKSSSFSVDFSNVNLGDLDFLTMISTPKSVSEMDSSLVDSNCNYTSVTSNNDSGMLPKIEVVTEVPNNMDQPSGGFLQKLCSESNNLQVFPAEAGVHNFPQQNISPSHVSSNSRSPVAQTFLNHSPQNLSPNHLQYSPEHSISATQQEIGQQHSPELGRNVSPNHVSPTLGYQPDQSIPQFGFSTSQSFSQALTAPTFQPSHFPANTCIDTSSMQPHLHQGLSHTCQMNSQDAKPFANYSQQQLVDDQTNSSVKRNFEPVPGLFVNTKQAQMPFRQLFQDAIPGPSGNQQSGNHLQVSHIKGVNISPREIMLTWKCFFFPAQGVLLFK